MHLTYLRCARLRLQFPLAERRRCSAGAKTHRCEPTQGDASSSFPSAINCVVRGRRRPVDMQDLMLFSPFLPFLFALPLFPRPSPFSPPRHAPTIPSAGRSRDQSAEMYITKASQSSPRTHMSAPLHSHIPIPRPPNSQCTAHTTSERKQ